MDTRRHVLITGRTLNTGNMTSDVSWLNGTNRAAYWLAYEQLSDAFYVATGICMTIFIVLAVLGNVLTLLVYWSSQMKSVSNWFIMNMAVADLLASSLCYPFVVIASFTGHWPIGHIGCFAYSIVVGTSNFAGISSMALVAMDRSLVVRRCTGNELVGRGIIGSSLSRKTGYVAIIVIWLYSATLTMPPLFGWGNYILDAMEVSCTFDYVSDDPTLRHFILLLVCFGFCLPLIVIVISYAYIFSRLSKYKKMTVTALRTHTPASLTPRMSDAKMAKVGVTVVAMFVLAWLPYGVMAMAGAFGRVQISPYVQMASELIAKASAAYNPIIYSMSHPGFRRRVHFIVDKSPVLSLIFCRLCCHRKVPREDSLSGIELEIRMNVNVRRKSSLGGQGNWMVKRKLSVCKVEVTQTMIDDSPSRRLMGLSGATTTPFGYEV